MIINLTLKKTQDFTKVVHVKAKKTELAHFYTQKKSRENPCSNDRKQELQRS